MYSLQLGNNWYVEINNGDLFIYRYSDNHFAIKTVEDDRKLFLDEFTVEILCLKTKKHYVIKRDNGYFWWEETKF